VFIVLNNDNYDFRHIRAGLTYICLLSVVMIVLCILMIIHVRDRVYGSDFNAHFFYSPFAVIFWSKTDSLSFVGCTINFIKLISIFMPNIQTGFSTTGLH